MKGQEDPLALEAAGRKRRLFLLRCASVSSGRADGLPSWSLPWEPPIQGFLSRGFLAPEVIDAKTPGAWKAVGTRQRSLSMHCPWEGELSCPRCAMLSHRW